MSRPVPLTGAQRVARRRATLRAQGLRPRTLWLPDRATAEFKARALRDVEVINAIRHESDTMAFIEAIQYWPEEEYDWGPSGPP